MKGKRSITGLLIRSILAIIIIFVTLFPLFWMFLSGFKPSRDIMKVPFQFFPSEWQIEHYLSLLSNYNFLRSMLVTFLGCIVFTCLVLTINSMAAYGFSRLDFGKKNLFWAYALLPMFIPGIAILVPSFIVVARLNLLNTYGALILPGIASAGTLFFLRQYYLGIPLSIEEAARIDGASRIKIYLKIFLPMSVQPFVIMGIGAFLGYWNAYIWPVMVISDEAKYQVMQFMAFFKTSRGSNWSVIMAGSTLTSIPTLILFIIFQRYIIQGIKISGLK